MLLFVFALDFYLMASTEDFSKNVIRRSGVSFSQIFSQMNSCSKENGLVNSQMGTNSTADHDKNNCRLASQVVATCVDMTDADIFEP